MKPSNLFISRHEASYEILEYKCYLEKILCDSFIYFITGGGMFWSDWFYIYGLGGILYNCYMYLLVAINGLQILVIFINFGEYYEILYGFII